MFSLGGSTEPPEPPLDPPQWSADTSFDRCQLTITWISGEEEHYKPRLHVSVNLLQLEYGRHPGQLHCHRGYAPTSNTASHDNHEKIDSWVSFSFL